MTHGWQSESTDGPKGGWSCAFLEWLQWLQGPPHSQLLDVVRCSAVVVVLVVVVVLLMLLKLLKLLKL